MPDENTPQSKRPQVTRALSLNEEDDGFELDLSAAESPVSLNALEKDRRSDLPILGEYLIEGKLGAGGMGQVFRARHRTMDREVALKILPRSMSQDTVAIDRFYSEVRATARLMHPNIVTAFDAGCFNVQGTPVHYLVMELIKGDLLSDRMAQTGPLSTQQVVDILAQAASALEYAHSQGIVHRDIKPSNMMLTTQGVLKILDFGLAVLHDHAPTFSYGKSQIVGTVEFMAPEQINAPQNADRRSDLYSLGATIFYLLTGRPMFEGEVVQTALAHVHRKPPALYEVRSDIDIRLDAVFQSLVAKNPDERLQSAAELTEKLIELNLLERKSTSLSAGETKIGKLAPIRPTNFGNGQSTSQRSYAAIGIDLGMIHSRVSYINPEHKIEEVLVDGEDCSLRNMLFSDGERIALGSQAVGLRATKPDHIFYGMQRWYGLPLLERSFGGRQAPPEVLVATILRHLLISSRQKLANASHAVVTVPACYDQMHRLSTRMACKIAGVELLQLLDKPLAATLAHVEIDSRLARGSGAAGPYQRTFLVAMLTGAACEVSLVRVDGVEIQMLATAGDWKRGTVRWHDRMAKKIASQIESRFALSAREDRQIASRIQRTVEKAFERMRSAQVVPFVIEVPKGKVEGRLDRKQLSEWTDELPNDCAQFAKEVLNRANVDSSEIDTILLVGDIRWLQSIQQELLALVGSHASLVPIDSADLARGAAIQADYMMPPQDRNAPRAISAASYDLGVVMQDDSSMVSPPRVLVPKDTVLPTGISKTLRFTREGKRQPMLQFVEGSRLGTTVWNKLGNIDLQTCFQQRSTSDPLQLRLEVEESGIWNGRITWPAGNDQLMVPLLNEPLMDIVSIRQWRDWLESLMLCNEV